MSGKMGKKLKNLFAKDFEIIRFCCVRIVKRQKFKHMVFNAIANERRNLQFCNL